MQHLDEGTIHSWLDGVLSAEEAARVEAHVKECPQCQAAVAEARGFIAASSRILTALDNAPRGVIPAAKPSKRIDPMVWRIAATVLVVAGGTLVVVRNSGLTERTRIKSAIQAPAVPAPSNITPSTGSMEGTAATTAPVAASAAGTRPSEADFSGKATTQISRAGAGAAQESRVKRRADEKSAAAPEAVVSREPAHENSNAGIAAAPLASTAPAPRFEALSGRVAGVAAMDAIRAEPKLRVVGTPRALGQKLTLYEVAPGDTVVLAEELRLELQTVVTAAAAAAAAPPRAIAGAEKARGLTKAGAVADTSRTTAAQAPTSAPATFPSFTQTSDGKSTLTWRDAATGNMMKLSGRHTRAELEEIRRRIEQERVAAADSAKKNR